MIYEVNNHWITLNKNQKIDLTISEHKLLMCLIDRKAHSYKEIEKIIYGFNSKYTYNALRQLKHNLIKKVSFLDIKVINRYGYILETGVDIKNDK